MITLNQGDCHFHYRAAGVALSDGHVLLHTAQTDDFWSVPGGRVDLLEPATAALCREMREELGIAPTVGRLLWVVENFFEYAGGRHHELGLYFLMGFPLDSPLYGSLGPFFGQEDAWGDGRQPLRLTFQWFPRDRSVLQKLPLYPAFLQRALLDLPQTPEHVVQRDADLSW
jgi:8-oxo-dGTP pyrophosphatase MutT (NUDIX family)